MVSRDTVIELLIRNTTSWGLNAARSGSHDAQTKHYSALYPRDIGICAYAIMRDGDLRLIHIIMTSLETLLRYQSDRGQMPFYVKPETDDVHWRWEAGSIDSTLWWALACVWVGEYDSIFWDRVRDGVSRALIWATYQDRNYDYALEQGEASDWMDEMPRHGTTLYTNALWYWLLDSLECVDSGLARQYADWRQGLYQTMQTTMWLWKKKTGSLDYLPDNEWTHIHRHSLGIVEWINAHVVSLPYFLASISHKTVETRFDTCGNLLAIISGLADHDQAYSILSYMNRTGLVTSSGCTALYPCIYPGEQDRNPYMLKGAQNIPHHYHNGGIRPMIGGRCLRASEIAGYMYDNDKIDAFLDHVSQTQYNERYHGYHQTPCGAMYQSRTLTACLLFLNQKN